MGNLFVFGVVRPNKSLVSVWLQSQQANNNGAKARRGANLESQSIHLRIPHSLMT